MVIQTIRRILHNLFSELTGGQPTQADSSKAKSQENQLLVKAAVEKRGVRVNSIIAFGHEYDSAFWVAVSTDLQRDELLADKGFVQGVNAIFADSGYLHFIEDIWNKEIIDPRLEYLKTPTITFESQETINRDYEGSWWYRIK